MAQSCEIDLFTLADNTADLSHKFELERYCHSVTVATLSKPLAGLRAIPAVLRGLPLTLPYFYSADLAVKIREALSRRSYDLIFVYSSSMAQYVANQDGLPILVDLVDVDSDKWLQYAMRTTFPQSMVFRREANSLRRYEREIGERACCVIVTTEREAGLLYTITSSSKVRVIPNGVDTDYFSPVVTQRDCAQPTLIFTGSMDYFPNVDGVEFFARRVLPSVRRAVPNTQLLIVGSRPTRSVRRLASLPGVQVTGFVADIRPYLSRSHVFVAPLFIASGTQNKILEAMAVGLPVITTPRGIQGLPTAVRELVQVAESSQEWVAQTCKVLRDRSLAQFLGTVGRQKVIDECSWEKHLCGLLDLIKMYMEVKEAAANSESLSWMPTQPAS
jgi:sugar transferase (PEP-CTERM/EpsH1 system associated)